MSWQDYVKAAQAIKFEKVCIVARANYQTLASSKPEHIATAWKDDKDVQINENQELLDNWWDAKKTTFCFFGKKWKIILKEQNDGSDDDGGIIACQDGKEGLIARQLKTIWFVAVCSDVSKGKDAKIKGLPNALNIISREILDALVENGSI